MSEGEPHVRATGPEALAAFLDLVEEAGAWLLDRGIPQWPPGSNRAQESSLREQLHQGTLLLARDARGLAGGCLMTRARHPAWAAHAGDAAYLHKLAVARSAAGRGLGVRIVTAAEAWARAEGLPRVRLDCWDGNERLRAYYRDLGYRELEDVAEHGYRVRLFEKGITPVVGSRAGRAAT